MKCGAGLRECGSLRNYRVHVAPAAFVRPLASMKRCITAGSLGVGAQSSTFQRNETHKLHQRVPFLHLLGGGYCRMVGTNAWREESRANWWC